MRSNGTVPLVELVQEMKIKMRDKLALGTENIPAVLYKCKTCNDVGLVRSGAPWGHPMFGKLVSCPDCQQARNTERHEDTSGLRPEEYELNWSNLLGIEGNNIKGAIRAVKSTLRDGYGWVYLHGGYGLGKTDLLKIAVARAMKNGMHAIYIKAEYLLDNLRAGLKNGEYDKLCAMYINVPVLAIDEFEKINPTEWGETRLFHILDDRWGRAVSYNPQGVTLIAANVPVDGIREGALRSRLRDERFIVYEVTGSDVRAVAKSLSKGE